MKYQPIAEPIPQDARAEINDVILQIADSGELPDGITREDIYQGYTGIGGLHQLKRADFKSFKEFTEAKKVIEQGQFFTPGHIIEQIADLVDMQHGELMLDLTCGAGAFFNHFPETQCHGLDIDQKAVKVAKLLYPGATIEARDIRFFESDIRFDLVLGNPPFNLRWELKPGDIGFEDFNPKEHVLASDRKRNIMSQEFFMLKAAQVMKLGGFMIIVVPETFLDDEFFNKSSIDRLNANFNFLCQYKLDTKAFKSMGVDSFGTKVMCFQRKAPSLADWPYQSVYDTYEACKVLMDEARKHAKALKAKLRADQAKEIGAGGWFEFRKRKLLYEIKQHPKTKVRLGDAIAHVEKLYNQKQPPNMPDKEWFKVRLTPNKVISYLEQILDMQNLRPRDEYKLVKTTYGFKMKAYSNKAAHKMRKAYDETYWSFNQLILFPGLRSRLGYLLKNGYGKLLDRKVRKYEAQIQPFDEMTEDPKLNTALDRFAFYNGEGKLSQFNDIQKGDLKLICQKPFSGILNWQQGGGKTPAAAFWMKLYPQARNTFVVGPAIAINLTWQEFMITHKKDVVNVRSLRDVENIRPGQVVLIGLEMLVKYQKRIKRYVKHQGYKVNMVFDESDEATNAAARRTRAVLNVFRKAKRKILTTGTTTRNNINEMFSQLELLYNNSITMLCTCEYYWVEGDGSKKKIVPETVEVEVDDNDPNPPVQVMEVIDDATGEKGELYRKRNPWWMKPFPAKAGALIFKRCFNPARTTVFGIQKHNQDVYNLDHLRRILSYSIRTRKFKEIAGDKYSIHARTLTQSEPERVLYGKIINELNAIMPVMYKSTGRARVDAMLRILRQLQLLIEATSTPHLFPAYVGNQPPNKVLEVRGMCDQWIDEKVAIGCVTHKATDYYYQFLFEHYGLSRQIFRGSGEMSFQKRRDLVREFQATPNGILVCTQQSFRSSVNIPECDKVILEAKQWNIPKMEQFFFRFIRYTSKRHTEVHFLNYADTIDMNLMALLLSKEKLNDFIKTLEYKDDSDVYEEYGVDVDILNSILTKGENEEGKVEIQWGAAEVVS